MERDIRVRKIKDGTVIDHITAGQALNVLRILNLPSSSGATVTVAMNVPSRKAGVKDIVKVEGRELRSEEVDRIALLAPEATINIVRNYRVVEKKKVAIPQMVEGVLGCANPNCITHFEPVKPRFTVESRKPIRLRCHYCERIMCEAEIAKQF